MRSRSYKISYDRHIIWHWQLSLSDSTWHEKASYRVENAVVLPSLAAQLAQLLPEVPTKLVPVARIVHHQLITTSTTTMAAISYLKIVLAEEREEPKNQQSTNYNWEEDIFGLSSTFAIIHTFKILISPRVYYLNLKIVKKNSSMSIYKSILCQWMK